MEVQKAIEFNGVIDWFSQKFRGFIIFLYTFEVMLLRKQQRHCY